MAGIYDVTSPYTPSAHTSIEEQMAITLRNKTAQIIEAQGWSKKFVIETRRHNRDGRLAINLTPLAGHSNLLADLQTVLEQNSIKAVVKKQDALFPLKYLEVNMAGNKDTPKKSDTP